jgi:hypothetical protein
LTSMFLLIDRSSADDCKPLGRRWLGMYDSPSIHRCPARSTGTRGIYPRIGELAIFRDGIPTLVPGREIFLLFDSFIDRKLDKYPDRYEATVDYDGPEGTHYRNETVLDLQTYRNLTYVVRRGVHDIHERLKEIAAMLKKWAAPWGGGGLTVSPADQLRRNREWEQRHSAETAQGQRKNSTD